MIRHRKHLKICETVASILANMLSTWNDGWHTMRRNSCTSSTANNWKRIQLMWWQKYNVSSKSLQSWTIRIIYDSIRKRDSFVKLLKAIGRNVWVNRKENRIRQWMIGAWKCYKGKWAKKKIFFFLLIVRKKVWKCVCGCVTSLCLFVFLRIHFQAVSTWIVFWHKQSETLEVFILPIKSYDDLFGEKVIFSFSICLVKVFIWFDETIQFVKESHFVRSNRSRCKVVQLLVVIRIHRCFKRLFFY